MDFVRILLTGCNRGLGKDLLQLIATKTPNNYFILGTVRKNIQEIQQNLCQKYPQRKIQIAYLDLLQKQSINKLFEYSLLKNYKFDIIVNNGAVGADFGQQIPSQQLAKNTMDVNIIGTINFTQKFLPLLKQTGRIINVSSKLSGLRYQQQNIRQIYEKDGLTSENIINNANQYVKRCKQKNMNGYFKSAYGTSKMFLNYWSKFILSKKLNKTQTTIVMSPGYCKTDMGGKNALRTSMEGATTIFNHLHGQYKSDIFYHLNIQFNFYDCGPQPK